MTRICNAILKNGKWQTMNHSNDTNIMILKNDSTWTAPLWKITHRGQHQNGPNDSPANKRELSGWSKSVAPSSFTQPSSLDVVTLSLGITLRRDSLRSSTLRWKAAKFKDSHRVCFFQGKMISIKVTTIDLHSKQVSSYKLIVRRLLIRHPRCYPSPPNQATPYRPTA